MSSDALQTDFLKKLLEQKSLQQLFNIFDHYQVEARLVGGCVRDALGGKISKDIDIAVDHPPEFIINVLNNEKIKVIPTGIKHGTVTALIDKQHFEITTLRQDYITDGRHAQVIFGKIWEEDAKRRDFTINALYLDKYGKLYDYFEGEKDLRNGIIRFIGEPSQRIQEDYLRILRYYRFYARFGKNELSHPPEISQLKIKLKRLSKERIQQEIFNLLKTNNPLLALELMKKDHIFEMLFDKNINLQPLYALFKLEQQTNTNPSLLCRFCLLFNQESSFYKKYFCLSNAQVKFLQDMAVALKKTFSKEYVFYHYGKDFFKDWCLIQGSLNLIDPSKIKNNLEWIQNKSLPVFPLTGQDLIDQGIDSGPNLGKLLESVKKWWIENSFEPSYKECLDYFYHLGNNYI